MSEQCAEQQRKELEAIDAAIQKLLKVKITPEERTRALRDK